MQGGELVETRKKVKLTVFDQAIHLRCTSPDEMHSLAREVERRMADFAAQDDCISVTQLAILAALSLAKEVVDTRQALNSLEHKLTILQARGDAPSNY